MSIKTAVVAASLALAAVTLTGCYDLNYADKQGVIHWYQSYSTENECWKYAAVVQHSTNNAWCEPGFFETSGDKK